MAAELGVKEIRASLQVLQDTAGHESLELHP